MASATSKSAIVPKQSAVTPRDLAETPIAWAHGGRGFERGYQA
jgi:hypothetical protein